MIFDDHDVHDDWNISETWVAQMRAKPWWEERVVGAYMSYWIYQHLGNLSPSALFDDPIFCAVQDAEGDCEELVRDFARTAVREIAGARWSYCRDFGRTRLVVVDSRAGRVLAAGPAPDALRRRVGLGRGPLQRRLRPPRHRHVAAGHARARHAPPRGLERGRLRRCVGQARRAAGRARAPGARPRALGRLPGLLHAHDGAAGGRRGGPPRPRAGDDHAAVGRRAPRLPRRGVVSRAAR